MIAAIAYQESGVRQFASDGYLIHNVTECKNKFTGASTMAPPGLGMMQLTGSTASSVEPQPWTSLRTDWVANLEAGVQILVGKMNAYLASSSTPSFPTGDIQSNRNVIENWYMPAWRYNGYVGNYGSYANKIFNHLANAPGVLAQILDAPIPATKPADVIPHFFDSAYGEAFVARADGTWTCKHGNDYAAAVHLTGGAPEPVDVDIPFVVTASALNVRAGPGTNYPIVGVMPQGQRYVAWQQVGDWYRFWFDGTEGTWCHAGYTAPDGGAVTQIVVDTAVREGPDAAAPQFGTAGAGQKYAVVETSGTWLRIQFAGDTGWIASADTTTPLAEPPPDPGTEPDTEPPTETGNTNDPGGGAGDEASDEAESSGEGESPPATAAFAGGGWGNAWDGSGGGGGIGCFTGAATAAPGGAWLALLLLGSLACARLPHRRS